MASPDAQGSRDSGDANVERLLGGVLRYGVIVAGTITALGGVAALMTGGRAPENFRTFRSEPPELRSIMRIISGAFAGHPQAIVQLGIVLLVATPILRVALSLAAFAVRRDRTYVVLTALVLILLSVSLFSGRG